MQKSNKLKLSSLLLLLSLPLYAFNLKPAEVPVQLGVFWGDANKTQHITMQDMIGDQMTVSSNSGSDHGNGLFGLGYYVHGLERERFQVLYGLNAYYLGNISALGSIVQEDLFTNLGYRYGIQNIPLYAAAKANIKTNYERYHVIVDVGIGPNFMKTTGYNDYPLNEITQPDHAFLGKNNVTFSATAGIGLRMNQVFGNAPLECGYRFFYLGQGQLKPRTDQILNNLSTGDVYANALVCSITV